MTRTAPPENAPAIQYAWSAPTPRDVALFDRLLRDFVPPNGFDAHGHLYDRSHFKEAVPAVVQAGPANLGLHVYRQRVSAWMPSRTPAGGLLFPFPARGLDCDAANRFVAEEVRDEPNWRALMLIQPADDPARIEAMLNEHRFVGFKVYHVFAPGTDTFNAPTQQFLPEWAWELADQRRLAITLHMVLPRALAEPANQRYIMEHCQRYPGAKLILAHAARGFCGKHTVEGIAALRGLDNVFFDTSAVCEAHAFEAILQAFGPTRLLYGGDFPVTEFRTRCVDLGDGFCWLNELSPDYTSWTLGQPTLLGLESLLALRQACRNQHLTDSDVEEIFCHAARRMLDLPITRPMPDVQAAYRHAKTLIPGGTQLLSKRPEMFAPDRWPAYYREARGCEIIDIQGNRYIDMSTGGILACALGYADPDVNAAVMRRVSMGSMATLQTYDEVELAELLIAIHPWAQMARFTRAGGEAMAVAVRIARAATQRDAVAICGYHGWHDWYLAANLGDEGSLAGHLLPGLEPAGVPAALRGTAFSFHYNQLDELDAAIARADAKLAAVVMEPSRYTDPAPGFLEGVRERCDRIGAKLILDEISIGWRLCLGGAHLKFNIVPDLAVFAKTLSNGFAMGAVLGNEPTMQAAQRSFISSAYWTEGVGPAAALAAVRKMQRLDLPAHLHRAGSRVMAGWRTLGEAQGVPVKVGGRPEMAILAFDHPQAAALTTLMTVRMLRHGFLAGGSFNAMLAHEDRHIDAYLTALESVFAELREAIDAGDIEQRLGSPTKHSHFARLT